MIENSESKSRQARGLPERGFLKTPRIGWELRHPGIDTYAQSVQYLPRYSTKGPFKMGFGEVKGNMKLIGIAIGVVLLVIFLLQNFEMTSFQFLVFTLFVAPKWLVLTVTFLLGFVLGYLYAKKKVWTEAKKTEPLV